jgi:hypothetical protein
LFVETNPVIIFYTPAFLGVNTIENLFLMLAKFDVPVLANAISNVRI